MTQTAETPSEATRDAILNAAKAISGVCDGAQLQDGSGFNAVDSPTAKSILATPSPTDRQIRCLWNMLRKYRLQLRGFGFEYDALVPPALPPRAEDGRFIAEGCRVKFEWVETRNGRRIAIVFAYNPTVIDAVKRTERSYFDKGRQCWILPDDPDRMEDALGELEMVDPPVKVEIEPELKERQDKVREERRQAYETSRAETSDLSVPTKIEPYPFQKAGIEWVTARGGRALIGDEMGCVDGNAEVLVQRAQRTRRLTLRRLYERWQQWDQRRPTFIRALVNGEFHQHPIVDILDKGLRPMVELLLTSGKKLRITPDHEICTAQGQFVEASKLRKGQMVVTNGKAACRICGSTKKVVIYPYAKFPGHCRTCVYRIKRGKPTWKGGGFVDQDGYVRISGMHGHPRANRGGWVYEHLLVMEKRLGRPVRRDETIHHRNGIKRDNWDTNLELTTPSRHMADHGRNGGYRRLHGGYGSKGGIVQFIPTFDKVISVRPVGTGHVFDVVCANPHRNFVANGIVVHNCGKTIQALGYLVLKPEARPALVMCPATLRINWYREVAKCTDFKAQIVCGKTALPSIRKLGVEADLTPSPDADIVIVNYDLLETQTPETWVKMILKGDKSVAPLLEEAGLYATKALGKGIKKATLWSQPILYRIMKKIGEQGRKANKRRFVKVFVNRTPMEEFLSRGFGTLICDESHYIKDHATQRTMAAMEIAKHLKHVLCMTGTPLLNRPKELWSQVSTVDPSIFPNFFEYAKRFCGGFEGQFGWDFSGASNLDELEQILRSRILIRRLKRQVLKELPAKTRITIPIVLEGKLKKYEKEVKPALERLEKLRKERDELKADLEGLDEEGRRLYFAEHAEAKAKSAKLTGSIIEEIDGVKKAAVHAKFDECLKFILDVHEQQGKVIVFMHHHETIDRMVAALEKEGKKMGRIDGRVPTAKRDPIKDAFQEGDTDFLVLGIRAASEGINLTASHTVVFVEFDWNPGRHQQAEDRVDRIGQTMPPTIYYLIALGTIEEKIAASIDAKREVVNAALGEGERTVQEQGIMDAILDDLLGPKKA